MHRLSDVDLVSKTATCSECGPVEIVMFGGGRTCKNRHNASLRSWKRRKQAEWNALHPPRPRGRPRTMPLVPKEPKQRVYGTHAHTLSHIDDENRTAVCAICGPVKIYVFKHENYTTRRCGKANSQSVMAAQRTRRERNREFIDAYKVEQGCQRCGYNASPIGLDFHHRNPAEKDFNITKVSKYSRERLLQEIEKCDVLCAICHRLVHDELGYVYE